MDTSRPRRVARWVAAASLGGAASLVLLAIALGSFDRLSAYVLLTFLGLAFGAFAFDLQLGALPAFPAAAVTSMGALLASQVCYHLLVWTSWKGEPITWRLWWISAAACMTSVHVLALRASPQAKGDWVERGTALCAGVSGLLLMSLSLRKEAPPEPGAWFAWALALPAAGSIAGSVVVWRRRRPKAAPAPVPRALKAAGLLGSQVAVFFAGFYFGSASAPQPSPVDFLPSALAGLPAEEVDAQARADLERLKATAASLDDLTRRAAALREEVRARRASEGRDYYLPAEEDQIRWNFVTYLSYRAALLRIVATHAGFESVRDPDAKARCFMVGYAGAACAYEAALTLVNAFAGDGTARRKLNEAEPVWGLSPGMFDQVAESVTGERNLKILASMAQYYDRKKAEWGGVWPRSDLDWLDARIARGVDLVRAHPGGRAAATFEALLKRAKEDVYGPVYAAQSMLSSWIGDTRLLDRKPLIPLDQIREIRGRLRPGDVILERRNWYLSNAFLPGFWPHSALYLGTVEDLRRLKVADHPEVKSRLAEYLKPGPAGEPHTILEAVSEGVVFNTLSHSLHADYVAVLRPRLSEGQVAKAIATAFSHQGKPYDFEFDFFTSDKLVCTELIYRAYQGLLNFELVKVMGRDTLPAVEIVRKFVRDGQAGRPELDFVLFLDGVPGKERARLGTREEFCASADRPRAFHE